MQITKIVGIALAAAALSAPVLAQNVTSDLQTVTKMQDNRSSILPLKAADCPAGGLRRPYLKAASCPGGGLRRPYLKAADCPAGGLRRPYLKAANCPAGGLRRPYLTLSA